MLRELVYTEAVCGRKYFFEKLFESADRQAAGRGRGRRGGVSWPREHRGRRPQDSPLPPPTKSSAFPKSTLAGRSRTPWHLNAPTAHCRVHCRAFCPGRRTFLAFPLAMYLRPDFGPRSAFPGSLRAILHRGGGKKPCNVHRTVRGNVAHVLGDEAAGKRPARPLRAGDGTANREAERLRTGAAPQKATQGAQDNPLAPVSPKALMPRRSRA